MEMLQLAQNENKVTLAAVHQQNAVLIRDTETTTHTRLTMTEEPLFSNPLFPPENDLSR